MSNITMKGLRMSEKLTNFFNSKIVSALVAISVPILMGSAGYFFSFMLDTTSRIIAIENTRFTEKDGRAIQDKISEHESQIMLLDSNQKRVITTLDRVVDNQTVMLQTQARIEAKLESN